MRQDFVLVWPGPWLSEATDSSESHRHRYAGLCQFFQNQMCFPNPFVCCIFHRNISLSYNMCCFWRRMLTTVAVLLASRGYPAGVHSA